MRQHSILHLITCAILAAMLAGCAGAPNQSADLTKDVGDPIRLYEPWIEVAEAQKVGEPIKLYGTWIQVAGDQESGGPIKLYGKWIQFAQTQDDSDSDLEDLFPSGDAELEDDFDPFETVNRFFFAINEALDVILLKPAAATYRFLLPEFAQDSIRNVIRNLKAPVVFANELWQGKDEEASETLARFGINSTLGLAGLIDVADSLGFEYHSEDFGQTLGFYGAEPGPYLVLPLFGPSSVRDAIGMGVDSLIDPWSYVLDASGVDSDDRTTISLSRRAAGGIDKRARNIENIEELQRDSVDFYARIRSLYLQNRRNLVKDGEPDTSFEASE